MGKVRLSWSTRSIAVSVIALVFLCITSLLIAQLFVSSAWHSGSYHWHSDALWGDFGSPQLQAQIRYEVPMTATLDIWAVTTFVACIGVLFRRNWARLLFSGAQILAALLAVGVTALFWSLYPQAPRDIAISAAIIVLFGLLAKMFLTPAIKEEFVDRSPRHSG